MIKLRLMAFLVCVLALSACKNVTKEDLGLGNKAPDEFMVMPRKPLSLPPEFELRPVVNPADQATATDNLNNDEAGLLDRLKK